MNTTLIGLSPIQLTVDQDCYDLGHLNLQTGGVVNTSINNRRVVIYGGNIDIDNDGGVDTGNGLLIISERCSVEGSLGIGTSKI